MKFSALALGFLAALCVAAPTPQDVAPPASEVYIDSFSYSGTGCKPGSAAPVRDEDGKTLSLVFDSYEARISPDDPPLKRHVNCVVNFGIRYPQGYQYTLSKIGYTGYAKLDQDVVGTQLSTYWFAGFPNAKAISKSTWTGKYDAPYNVTSTLPTGAWVWSPCSANTTLNVNTVLDLTNNNRTGSGTISAYNDTSILNVKSAHIYAINWRKC